MRRYDINPLYRYFCKVAGKEDTDRLFRLYRVGTSRMWDGATVFWQIDAKGNVRAGKIMGYDAESGHRVKEPFNQVNWVHSVRKMPDFRMKQCFHGCFNSEAVQALRGREVILFPDLKATEEWRRRLPMLEPVCRRATCSDLLEKMATDGQRSHGLDIADFLLMEDTPQMILARMMERNPVLQTFIDTFRLELVDAGRAE